MPRTVQMWGPTWERACLRADAYLSDTPQPNCGSWLACDDGLPADAYLSDTPQSNCGSALAREDGLTVNTVELCTYPFLR